MPATLALAGSIIGFIGAIIVLIQAFKSSVLDGCLTLLVPFYVLYFIYKDWENDSTRKGLYIILAGFFLNVLAAFIPR